MRWRARSTNIRCARRAPAIRACTSSRPNWRRRSGRICGWLPAGNATASSHDRHAPCRDRGRRDHLDVERYAPSLGETHARRLVADIAAFHDEAFEAVGHDFVALLNIDREAT